MRVQAPSESPANALYARDRLARLGHREAELGVGLPGRDLLVRLAAHVGRDAHEHRLLARGAGVAARPARAIRRASRSISSKLSITISPTPARSASASSASDLALPCRTIRSGCEAGAEREVQLAAGGDVAPQPLLPRTARAPRCRERPWRRTRRASRRGRRRGRPPGRPARARAGRPRRRRRRACRTRARARSRRSRRPAGARAR